MTASLLREQKKSLHMVINYYDVLKRKLGFLAKRFSEQRFTSGAQ